MAQHVKIGEGAQNRGGWSHLGPRHWKVAYGEHEIVVQSRQTFGWLLLGLSPLLILQWPLWFGLGRGVVPFEAVIASTVVLTCVLGGLAFGWRTERRQPPMIRVNRKNGAVELPRNGLMVESADIAGWGIQRVREPLDEIIEIAYLSLYVVGPAGAVVRHRVLGSAYQRDVVKLAHQMAEATEKKLLEE